MPQMANITVKKADGTTDVVFKARQPSSGDQNAARWSPDSSGARGARASFEVVAQKSGASGSTAKRRVSTSLIVPVVRTENGTDLVVDVVRATTQFTFPLSATDSEIEEAVALHSNLTGAQLVRSTYEEGYAPT